jgi:protein gp37
MSKIEWTDMTWNPVWGCENNCDYCYARKFARRFYWNGRKSNESHLLENLKNFKPTWIQSNFKKKFPKKPSRIFVNSMSDIAYWKKEWMYKVKDKINKYPHHTFQFLTKKPDAYSRFMWPENCLLGVTITNQEQLKNMHGYFNYISFEPLHGPIDVLNIPSVRWVIIGAETGNRKNKIVPKWGWILDIMKYCASMNIPFFLKNNLKKIVPNQNWELIRQFPESSKDKK